MKSSEESDRDLSSPKKYAEILDCRFFLCRLTTVFPERRFRLFCTIVLIDL